MTRLEITDHGRSLAAPIRLSLRAPACSPPSNGSCTTGPLSAVESINRDRRPAEVALAAAEQPTRFQCGLARCAIGSSSMTDNLSAPVASPDGLGTGSIGGLTMDLPNAASVGTGLNLMACQTIGAYTVQTCSHLSASGAVGVATTGIGTLPGTSGNVSLCYGGKCTVYFDNSATPGDYAIFRLPQTGTCTTPDRRVRQWAKTTLSSIRRTAALHRQQPSSCCPRTRCPQTLSARSLPAFPWRSRCRRLDPQT